MVRVIFEAGGSSSVEVEAKAGDHLVDLADAHGAPVPFSCRSASCGICMVEVLEGARLLAPADEDEREVLADQATSGADRLTCQAVVRADQGTIRVRAGGSGGV